MTKSMLDWFLVISAFVLGVTAVTSNDTCATSVYSFGLFEAESTSKLVAPAGASIYSVDIIKKSTRRLAVASKDEDPCFNYLDTRFQFLDLIDTIDPTSIFNHRINIGYNQCLNLDFRLHRIIFEIKDHAIFLESDLHCYKFSLPSAEKQLPINVKFEGEIYLDYIDKESSAFVGADVRFNLGSANFEQIDFQNSVMNMGVIVGGLFIMAMFHSISKNFRGLRRFIVRLIKAGPILPVYVKSKPDTTRIVAHQTTVNPPQSCIQILNSILLLAIVFSTTCYVFLNN